VELGHRKEIWDCRIGSLAWARSIGLGYRMFFMGMVRAWEVPYIMGLEHAIVA